MIPVAIEEMPKSTVPSFPKEAHITSVCVELLNEFVTSQTRDQALERADALRAALSRLERAPGSSLRYWLHHAESHLNCLTGREGDLVELVRGSLGRMVDAADRWLVALEVDRDREYASRVCLDEWPIIEAIGPGRAGPKELIGVGGINSASDASARLAKLASVGLAEVIEVGGSVAARLSTQGLCVLRNPIRLIGPLSVTPARRSAAPSDVDAYTPEHRLAAGFGDERALFRSFYETPEVTCHFYEEFDLALARIPTGK
ncbi:MAG: hypothetical protein U0871_01315 [Gemmataceae bacterium]